MRPLLRTALATGAAVALTVIVVSTMLMLLDADPWATLTYLLRGAFGNAMRIGGAIGTATPLILTGLSVAVAFRCRLWNIGAEGQLYIGATFTTLVGILGKGIPPILLVPLCLGVGLLGGAAWGAIPGLLKTRFKSNEVLVTLMLNYVALLCANMVITGPLRNVQEPKTVDIQPAAWLPMIWPSARVHAGILVALIAVFLTYLLLFRTVLGYRIRATGLATQAARYGGIAVNRTMIAAFVISGALAGLAGSIQVMGVHHCLVDGFSPGYGFTGIVVALLGRLHPLWIVVSGYLLASLSVGAQSMQILTRIPTSVVYVIQGVLVLTVLGMRVVRMD